VEQIYLLFPLASGLVYAFSALALKPAVEGGVGAWRVTAITQWAISLTFSFFLLRVEGGLWPDPFWPSLVAGLLFFLGGLFTIISIRVGDISVATPVMGSKVLWVAVLVVLFLGDDLDWTIWVGAGLTVAGLVILNMRWDVGGRHKRTGFTIAMALLASLCFASVDVMAQHWCTVQGFELFIAWSSLCAGMFAFTLIPFFREPIWRIPRPVVKYLALGAGGMAFQAIGMAVGVGYFADAAGSNIAYSGRGIWSVALVWAAGHWFRNEEKHAGRKTMIARIGGSLLVTCAIILLFL